MAKHKAEANGVTTISKEDLEQATSSITAVNLDEVTIEIIPVRCRYYREEPLLDDEGQPLLSKNGTPRIRRVPALRTAHIQNMVTLPMYNRVIALQGDSQLERSAQLEMMNRIVLEVWQISEPDMTYEELVESVDGAALLNLFTRFFMNNPLLRSKVSPDGNTTSDSEQEL